MLGSGLLSSTHGCCPVSKDFQQILDMCPKFNLELQFRRRIFDPWFYNYLDIQLSISLQNEDTKESKPNKQFYARIESKGSRGAALLSHTGHVRYGHPATLTRVPRFKTSQIKSKLWALLLYHQCSILTGGISKSCIDHVDRTRSAIRVPLEKR